MTIYLLKPCFAKSQDWIGSDYLEYFIIEANDGNDARKIASERAWILFEPGDDRKCHMMGIAWLNPKLTSCEEIHKDQVQNYRDHASDEDREDRGTYILKEGQRK